MKKWKKKSTNVLFESGIVRLSKNAFELPDGRTMPEYFVLDFSDWANVVAITKNKKLLMVKQYRAAADVVTLEVPGGSIDPGEDIQIAALRELREETGYRAIKVGEVRTQLPNPATQTNRVHTIFVPECEFEGEAQPDEFESFELVEFGFSELKQAIQNGQIQHSLILGALLLFWDELEKNLVP